MTAQADASNVRFLLGEDGVKSRCDVGKQSDMGTDDVRGLWLRAQEYAGSGWVGVKGWLQAKA